MSAPRTARYWWLLGGTLVVAFWGTNLGLALMVLLSLLPIGLAQTWPVARRIHRPFPEFSGLSQSRGHS